MVMFREPVRTIHDIVRGWSELGQFPMGCVFLYGSGPGLDSRIAYFINVHWDELDALSGQYCLVFVLPSREDPRYEARLVYDIARALEISVDMIPCVVFFENPESAKHVVVFPLRRVLDADKTYEEEDLLAFLRELFAVVERAAKDRPRLFGRRTRISTLEAYLRENWPEGSRWKARLEQAEPLMQKIALTAPVLAVIVQIIKAI